MQRRRDLVARERPRRRLYVARCVPRARPSSLVWERDLCDCWACDVCSSGVGRSGRRNSRRGQPGISRFWRQSRCRTALRGRNGRVGIREIGDRIRIACGRADSTGFRCLKLLRGDVTGVCGLRYGSGVGSSGLCAARAVGRALTPLCLWVGRWRCPWRVGRVHVRSVTVYGAVRRRRLTRARFSFVAHVKIPRVYCLYGFSL